VAFGVDTLETLLPEDSSGDDLLGCHGGDFDASNVDAHTYIHTNIHACVHTCVCIYICVCVFVCIFMYVCMWL